MAAGEHVGPHVGEFLEGRTFTRFYWQLELDERLHPTGREILPGGLPAPRDEPRSEPPHRPASAAARIELQ
jgi:carbamoyl-phosphate synthase large subunit